MTQSSEAGASRPGLWARMTGMFAAAEAHGLPDEAALLAQRRQRMGEPAAERHEALALSGGGIRSATFSLGVLQALAEARRDPAAEPGAAVNGFRASMLARFDYLSTVSGGGFIGAFLVGLFVPERLRPHSQTPAAAADDAQAVLASGPPERIRSASAGDAAFRLKAPLAWLRENGRYLSPTGSGDMVYAAALGLRNWVSLHGVIGVALLTALLWLALLRGWLLAQPWGQALRDWEAARLGDALRGLSGPDWSGAIWWSSLLPLVLLPLLAAVLAGLAFWMVRRRPDGRSLPVNLNLLGMVFTALVLAGMARALPPGPLAQAGWGLAGLTVAALLLYMGVALAHPRASDQGVWLTRALAFCLSAGGALLLLALVETLGQTLYLLVTHEQRWLPGLPAALAAALAWVGKKISGRDKSSPLPAWLQKLPLTTLGGLAGLAILVLVASLWALVAQFLIWSDQALSPQLLPSWRLGCMAGGLLLIAVAMGQFPAFINLSSLQGFYSARLIRSYLGASNGERFQPDNAQGLTAAEPLPRDNLPLDRFWSAAEGLRTWAPLHLVNLTVNKTVDPAEQLVQRDRKGQPMAVLPYGFSIDRRAGAFPSDSASRLLHAPMHLGEWVGASGAAFSTGIGRESTLGMSLLMGAANVRLGVWWASGLHRDRPAAGFRPWIWLGRGLGMLFRTQTYLVYEFTARFMGLNRHWQYLSDGGHFENTALYELLRPQRRVGFVFASDNGADPDYRFDDLANLIRLARIDLRTEIRVMEDFGGWPTLRGVFGATTDFSATRADNPAALLLRAQRLVDTGEAAAPPCWIVLLKPARQAGVPADVRQYAATHASFPQEPTVDQFFDEAQWESYRSLGQHTARRLLNRETWAALQAFMAADPAAR